MTMYGQPGVFLTVDRDGWTKAIQLSIGVDDENGNGHGYRIAGPKYNGSSKSLIRHRLSIRDITEIEQYLAKAKTLLAAGASS